MANYPDVRAAQERSDNAALAKAMHTAFEDQLVQKIMPKLRGIDTRGRSMTECLSKIRGQLVAGIGGNSFNLAGDFDIACELGYGQFIWQSANYLNADDTVSTAKPAVDENNTSNSDEEPPDAFQSNVRDREKRKKAWLAKSPEQRTNLRATLAENQRTGKIPRT